MYYPWKTTEQKVNKASSNIISVKRKNHKKKNLGMILEKDINNSNSFYQQEKKALIFKNAVPIQIVKVEYPKRQKAKIVEAYYRLNSLPDYHGIYKNRYLSFDVKQTENTKYFSLNNISAHQINYLKQIQDFGGISFLIIYFKKLNEYFYLPIDFLISYYVDESNKKNIPYYIFKKYLWNIPFGYRPRIDFLQIVDKFI
ncbi:MAG: Holliday junction resolvase RecU [Vigna little leaf phytoplasma]|nr:Holliday junction resolvase RecU [Vigna little leaf phytoplasma]